jgi:hypothetical protein
VVGLIEAGSDPDPGDPPELWKRVDSFSSKMKVGVGSSPLSPSKETILSNYNLSPGMLDRYRDVETLFVLVLVVFK